MTGLRIRTHVWRVMLHATPQHAAGVPCGGAMPQHASTAVAARCDATDLLPHAPRLPMCTLVQYAADKYGAAEIVDPRPFLVGSMLYTYKKVRAICCKASRPAGTCCSKGHTGCSAVPLHGSRQALS